MIRWCLLIGCSCKDVAQCIDDDWDGCDLRCAECPDSEDTSPLESEGK